MPSQDVTHTIISHITENIEVKQQLLDRQVDTIKECTERFITTLQSGGKILFCGNGGSAADSQHLAAELVVRLRGSFDRPPIPALALTVDTSILTAGANDYGFEQVFARQIAALARPGDLLVAISTSGNSPNILRAVEQAKKQHLYVIGFLGGNGGKLKKLVDLPLIIPSQTTARIQESHILIGHIICELVEMELFG